MNHPNIKSVVSIHSPRPSRRVLAALLCALGAAAFAVAILAGSALAATTNLVKNGSFEKDSSGDGIPNNWHDFPNILPIDKRVCNQSKAGNCSFLIVGNNSIKQLYQTMAVSGLAGDEFDLSFWAKGKDLILSPGDAAGVVLAPQLNAGGEDTSHYSLLPAGSSPWTLQELHAEASGDFYAIRIYLYLYADSGKVWFDKVKLVGP